MNKCNIKILIVDDEETLCEGLRTYLEMEGYDVDTAPSAENALSLNLSQYHLILLDIMMGAMSGTELAIELKKRPDTADIPIIFLTAKDSADDMVVGLKTGADDYIAKPYSIKVVLARIEAVMRRYKPQNTPIGITCDRKSLKCTVDGNPVLLPRKEFEILALLSENPGRVFSRDELLKRLWPENVVVTDRSVDVHMTRLRSKIAPYGKNIITRSGYGYGWQEQE